MTATADQPSYTGEKAPERTINFTPPLEQHAEYTQSRQTDTTTNPVRIEDNKIEVPPLNVQGWQGTGTMDGTAQFLQLTNPYNDALGVKIGGHTWTTDGLQLAQAAPGDRQTSTAGDRPSPDKPGTALAPSDAHNQKLLDAARGSLGERLWKGSPFERSAAGGRLGGAASVSQILMSQGYDYARSPQVAKLTNSMIANGWQLVGLNDAKPGDIIFGGKGPNWRSGGGNARIGMVGEDGKIYYNSPETGKWTLAEKNTVFGAQFGDQVWALRPPEGGPRSQRSAPAERQGSNLEARRQPAPDYSRTHQRVGDWNPDRSRTHQRVADWNPDTARRRRAGQEMINYQDYRDFNGNSNFRGDAQQQNAGIDFNPFSILQHAIEGIGEALWSLTPFRNSVKGGRLGCAASVSEVLQRAGYRYANHAGVGGLESQLMRNGWTKAPLSEAAPGDVVMIGRSRGWRAGGGSAHVGIVGENGTVYHNNSSRGRWIHDNLRARFGGGIERFVLKPPAGDRHPISPRMFVNQDPEVLDTRRQTGRRAQYSGGDDSQFRGNDSRGDRSERRERGWDGRQDRRAAYRGNDTRDFSERMFSRDDDRDYGERMGRRERQRETRERDWSERRRHDERSERGRRRSRR